MLISKDIETLQALKAAAGDAEIMFIEYDGDTFTVETGPTEAAQEIRNLERQYGTCFNGNAH
jgi:hypothetical protein